MDFYDYRERCESVGILVCAVKLAVVKRVIKEVSLAVLMAS